MSNQSSAGQKAARAASAAVNIARGAAAGGVYGAAVEAAKSFLPELIRLFVILLCVVLLVPMLVFTALPNILFGYSSSTDQEIIDFTASAQELDGIYQNLDNYQQPAVLRLVNSKPTLLSLDLNKLDEDLSEEERNEWNAIYASYRSKSILTGRIMGIDTHSFTVRNRETRQTERRKMLCAVIINYRVKVLIPETEVWYPGQERPPYVLRNMSGAETDYIILDVDREGGVAIGSRRMALAAQRHFFDTIKGGRSIGEKLTCRVLAVGPRRCLVECGGRDMSLSQKDLTYIATPDLRTRYHPGQTLNCVLKEYDRREGQFWVSVKDTVDNPFFGALRRHPIGSRRQAVISGKYGGGVFCTLSDETVCLCHYSTLHSDLDFHVGDTVILAIKQFDYERSLIYGRILSKW